MGRRKRIAIVTHGFEIGGGVPTVARWLRGALESTGEYVVDVHDLATSRLDPDSRRIMAPATWIRTSLRRDVAESGQSGSTVESASDRTRHIHWGANGAEIEFMRYLPRAELSSFLHNYDLIQVVAGGAAWARSVGPIRRPVVLQIATRAVWERASQMTAYSGPLKAWRSTMTAITTRVERTAIRAADAVLVENDDMRKYVLAVNQQKVAKAPPGVNTDVFTPPSGGWNRDGYLLSVCRLGDPRKGLDRLIRAYAALTSRLRPPPGLVLAGRGRLLPATEDLIKELGLSRHIVVRRDVTQGDLIALYRQASVFVQPSFEEGLGLSVLEAMACGLPVVATETSGSRETVANGINGWLVPQNIDESVCEAIAERVEFLLGAGLGEKFSRQSRERCVRKYSTEASLQLYLSTYDRLIGLAANDVPRKKIWR